MSEAKSTGVDGAVPATHELRAKITESYSDLRSIFFGVQAVRAGHLQAGRVKVLLSTDPDFVAEGALDMRGLLSGMSRLYNALGLRAGDEVIAKTSDTSTLTVVNSPLPQRTVIAESLPRVAPEHSSYVFERLKLNHLHIESFRPENLNHWEPETETDVYMAFGVLAEFTDFRYCCGASADLLRRLGADYTGTSKPDAILIDRRSDRYLMAEWKMRSNDYSSNHKPQDVDVLVCWIDDAVDRSVLPPTVLALREIAKKAAEIALQR